MPDQDIGKSGRLAWWSLFFLALILGIYLRGNGVAHIGFSGDEETTTMAVQGWIDHGVPQFPSGMHYYRSILHLFLIRTSFGLFGEGEWQARLPSLLLGIGTILLVAHLAYLVHRDRRFALLAGILAALSVYQIEEARTARMYGPFIFFHTAYLVFCARFYLARRIVDIILATVFFIAALFCHVIGVFGVFFLALQFFVVRRNRERLAVLLSTLAGGLSWLLILRWNQAPYGSYVADRGLVQRGSRFAVPVDLSGFHAGIAVCLVILFALLLLLVRKRKLPIPVWISGICGLLAVAGLIHLAWIFCLYVFLLGKIRPRGLGTLGGFLLIATGAYLAWHFAQLHSPKAAILATFSTPHLTEVLFLRKFPILLITLAVTFLVARRRSHTLGQILGFALLTSLVVISFFHYQFPVRYLAHATPLMLIVYALPPFLPIHRTHRTRSRAILAFFFFLVVFAEISPPRHFLGLFHADYGSPMAGWDFGRPDHKGAAEYVRAHQTPEDVIIAVDALEMQYYVGRVDYWLRNRKSTGGYFYEESEGQYRDFYTSSLFMSTPGEIEEVVRNNPRVWLIDSGETFAYPSDGTADWLRRYYLAEDVIAFIEDSEDNRVYRGRDGLTDVYFYASE